jgi:outer membrane beta-barrel protein
MKTLYKSPLSWMLLACFLIALFALSGLAKADDVVQFPESELARESVLPVFDQPEAVKKRFVPTDGRIEISGFLGTSLNDPFLDNYPLGVEVNYHLNEISSVGLIVEGYANTNTSYVAQLQSQVTGSNTIPFAQNPQPTFATLAEYEFTPYYGKISLSKQNVLNLNISATARAGMINLSVGGSSIAGGLGLNERFFFTRNFGIKLDLSALFYTKPDILGPPNATTTVTELFFTLGAVWLLPTL